MPSDAVDADKTLRCGYCDSSDLAYEAREHGVDKITRAEGEEWWA